MARSAYLKIIDYNGGTSDLTLKQSIYPVSLPIGDTYINNIISKYPETISQELDLKTSSTTVSSMFIEILNKSLAMSSIIYSNFYANNLYDKKCELCFYDTILTTTELVYTGYIKNITSDIYETKYTIELQDSIEKLQNASLKLTTLNNEVFSIATVFTENIASGTGITSERFGRKEESGHSGIEYNFMDTLDQPTFNGWTEEKWIVLMLQGHPIDIAKYLIASLNAEYDNASFEVVRNDSKNISITSFNFYFKEPINNTLEFIIKQLLIPLNCYPIIKSNGKIYLNLYKQPTSINPPVYFDEDNIIEITQNETSRKDIVNHTFISFDYNVETSNFISKLYDSDNGTSTIIFGESPKEPKTIEILGINKGSIISSSTDLDDRIAFAKSIATYLFNRFSLNVKTIALRALYSFAKDINLGDIVIIQGTKLICWKGDTKNTRGLPILDFSNIYGLVDVDYWGEYTGLYDSNLFLSDTSTTNNPKSIRIESMIKLIFFQDLLYAYDNNVAFLAQHNRP